MNDLSRRTQIAVLWFVQTVNYVSLILITQIESRLAGTPEPESDVLLITIFFFIPCLLAWLAFVLKPAVGRWLHVVFGALFASLKLVVTVGGLASDESFGYLFNEVWGFLAAVLLVWTAWKLAPAQD